MIDISEVVFKIIAKIAKKNPDELSLGTLLTEDLMMKSMSKIELAALLETQYEVSISNFEIRRPKTIEEVIALVQSKIQNK